jgi:RNA recognition motif-containing protein
MHLAWRGKESPGVRIYVGNLSYRTEESEIRQLFAAYGAVDNDSMVMDRETGRSRGFAFVEMTNDAEGKKAMDELNGKDFQGRSLTVN